MTTVWTLIRFALLALLALAALMWSALFCLIAREVWRLGR